MNPFEPSPEACDGCGTIQTVPLFIHSIRYRAITRRFCTNCVLKQHQGTFCPICFQLFDDSLLPHLRLMCVRCPSIAHRSCAFPSAPDSSAPSPPFRCPACADPNFSYLKLSAGNSVAIDLWSAKVLVAAAQIAANSMTRAAAAARLDAERRVREAAVARKKATEALEHLAALVAQEQGALTGEGGGSAA